MNSKEEAITKTWVTNNAKNQLKVSNHEGRAVDLRVTMKVDFKKQETVYISLG